MTEKLGIDLKCIGLNQWTTWANTHPNTPDIGGNDYEFLENHK